MITLDSPLAPNLPHTASSVTSTTTISSPQLPLSPPHVQFLIRRVLFINTSNVGSNNTKKGKREKGRREKVGFGNLKNSDLCVYNINENDITKIK
ncbi:hypothetical protein Glove_132g105 [Diversispora epigaea]|uniref:Uncharacterized protein n=1 Tax=Diversispora epigaea TaxID=1348612 RepID=A0A397J7K8_9GLOM|nr:hypothetical protein Glove_132g105 [Diversispora epigaea]